MAKGLQSWLRATFGGGGSAGASTPRVALGAFGKHPGWEEHIDGFLNDANLVAIKTALYGPIEEGIGRGEWKALDKAGQGTPFRPPILWGRKGGGHTNRPTWARPRANGSPGVPPG